MNKDEGSRDTSRGTLVFARSGARAADSGRRHSKTTESRADLRETALIQSSVAEFSSARTCASQHRDSGFQLRDEKREILIAGCV